MLDIKDVKKGNLVECLHDYGTEFTKGKIYEVSGEGYNKNRVDIVKDDEGEENGWLMKYFKLHVPKQDLRELLQVGYKVVYRSGNIYELKVHDIEYFTKEYDELLHDKKYENTNNDICEIHRPKYNGIKPMEWVLVWKREDELFSLRLKGNVRLPYYAKGNSKTKYDYTFRKNSKPVNEEKYQVRLTQEDIEKLPKELVALLEIEKVQ